MPTPPAISLDDLRRYAVGNTLFAPTTLARAIKKLGFVQADPIRAPARAQDLTLRHRVKDYRAGDLEKRYPTLAIEEDFFVNYGFLPRDIHALMHPRTPRTIWNAATHKRAAAILDFVATRGMAHPRDVDAHFDHGRAANNWGGTSNATTKLLDGMHYRGMLRVARREKGIRLYAPPVIAQSAAPTQAQQRAALDVLVDVVIQKYAPLPASAFSSLVGRLCFGAPQWRGDIKAAVQRAKTRLQHTRIDGVDWYWPSSAKVGARHHAPDDTLRLLAPFDPIVWDRKRFVLLWGWAYRFEAYTPPAKRKLGYYALPMLWREYIIGWANVAMQDGALTTEFGYVSGRAPKERVFKRALNDEIGRMQLFLTL